MFGIEANKARTRSWGDRLVPIGHRKDTGEAGDLANFLGSWVAGKPKG
jgi:hypothetical protein